MNSRNYYLHKWSKEIVEDNQLIITEDLNIKGMIQHPTLSKSISDVSWGKFLYYLEYKSKLYDRTFHQINRYYASSQTCSECGVKHKKVKNCSVREWVCPNCGVVHDRDENASNNILVRGLIELKL